MSGSHCTPHRGATILLKHKKTDEAQKAETVLSAVIYIYIYIYMFRAVFNIYAGKKYSEYLLISFMQ